jgi:hypothetical protein
MASNTNQLRVAIKGTYETPHGALYEPKPLGIQVALLFLAFIGGPAIGWLTRFSMDDVSSAAQLFLYVPPTLVFFLGYALWAARLAAIAFDMIGKSILRALVYIIIRRKKPERMEELLPDRDQLERMAVRAQKAAWSFFAVSVFIGISAAGLSALFLFEMSGAAVVLLACLGWGYVLGLLGRRGYLPLPEPSD